MAAIESEIIDNLKWCRNQANIKFVPPSEDITRANFAQARVDLQAMNAVAKDNNAAWTINSGYYARYHAVSALLDEFGLKVKNHACVVRLFEYLFTGFVSQDDMDSFAMSKNQRIDSQYYSAATNMDLNEADLDDAVQQARQFVFKMEKLIDEFRSGKQDTTAIKQKIDDIKSW